MQADNVHARSCNKLSVHFLISLSLSTSFLAKHRCGKLYLIKSILGQSSSAMRRYPSQATSLGERSKFVSLWIGGKSARSIARDTGVSPSTVCRWINRWKQEGNVNNHKPKRNMYPFLSRWTYMRSYRCWYNTVPPYPYSAG